MCEFCKPKNISLMLMVESHNGQISVPMRVTSDMQDAQPDVTGFTLNGLDCCLDLSNSPFVLSFMAAAMAAVNEAVLRNGGVDPAAMIKAIRSGIKELTPEDIERILTERRASKKVLQ